MGEEGGGRGMAEALLQAVEGQVADDEAAPPPQTSDVLHLRLEYQNIRHIQGLWDFTALTELHLNNNLIDKILGLELLTRLKKLDLSFNHIKKMEGLRSLWKLKSLNLSNNKISVIENLDSVQDLTHFFFANNQLEHLDNVLYLRRFRNMFTINLFGNPAVDDDRYPSFMAAHFPSLVFLDCSRLDDSTKTQARLSFQCALEELRSEEAEKRRREEALRKREAEHKLHKEAFVEFLRDHALFDSMFQNDPEMETLRRAPGIQPLLDSLKSQMVAPCTQLFETGLAEHERRETEEKSFRGGVAEVETYFQQKQSQMVEAFDGEHRQRISALQQLSDPDQVEREVKRCGAEVERLYRGLVALEVKKVRQVEKSIKEFDSSVSEMASGFVEAAEGIFVQCRGLEDDYHRRALDTALETLAKVATDTQDEDVPQDVVMLFTDKDAVMDALTTGHNNHVVKLYDRETQLVAGVHAWKLALIREITDQQLFVQRSRISDFLQLRDYLTEQLEEFQ